MNCPGVSILCRNSTFRKIPGKDGKVPILPKDSRSQKTRRRGATRGPHHVAARVPLGLVTTWCGRLGHPLGSPFRLLKPLDLKTPGERQFFHEEFRSSAAIENPNSGIRNSVLAPCRDGELEEIIAIVITNASPSTIHVSPIHV